MRKRVFVVMLCAAFAMTPVICTAQTIVSDSNDSAQTSAQDSSQDSVQQSSDQSSQDSTQQSSQDSSQQSSQDSTGQSSNDSSQQTTGASSVGSSEATAGTFANTTGVTEATTEASGESSAVVLLVGGAVVAIGATALGVILIVHATNVRQANVIALQDQIYAAEGPDFDILVRELGITEAELVRANDELVAEGYVIECDQDAADYLVALILKLHVSVEVLSEAG